MKTFYFIMVILLLLTWCEACISIDYPKDNIGPQVTGVPYDENSLEPVYGYVLQYGPEAIGRTALNPLNTLTDIQLVANIFPCGNGNTCYGITYTDNPLGGNSTIAMVTADGRDLATTDLRCTALTHELMHTLLYDITGDPDTDHTTAAVWAMSGMVNSAMMALCPNNYIIPQCDESWCR